MKKTDLGRAKVSRKKEIFLPMVLVRGFFLGDKWWAKLRMLCIVGTVIVVSIVMARVFEKPTLVRVWDDLAFPVLLLWVGILFFLLIVRSIYEADNSKIFAHLLLLAVIIAFALWFEYKLTMVMDISGSSVRRYLVMPLLGLVSGILAGARYIQDIYNLDSYALALLYLLSSFWGIAYPKLTISEGRRLIEQGKVNRLTAIGGPGEVTVKPGNVILLEQLHALANIHSAGTFFVPRFASIASIVNLNDQLGSVTSISAITKDGISVTVREIQFRYRIWSRDQSIESGSEQHIVNPYPYSIQAVRNIAYNQSVGANSMVSWSNSVERAIIGRIKKYISEHQLDQITAPRYQEKDPRDEIRQELFQSTLRDALKDIGAQLLWCDIGHFEVENSLVNDQRLETWRAKWIGNANVIRAYGEAQRSAYQELGRAEAQAELLISVIHAFDDIDLSKETRDQNIRNVVLIRTAEVLEALSATNILLFDNGDVSSNSASKKEEK